MILTEELITTGLQTESFGKKIYSFASIDSTNTFAKTLSKEDSPHGTIIIADEQTAGRGRLHRTWLSPQGENLLFSVVIRPEFKFEKTSLIPFTGALAVADSIESATSLSPSCKWPNDVLVNGKKVCGMLLESSTGAAGIDKVILGIGVNVNQTNFPEELQMKATSLKNESGRDIDRARLLQIILAELELRYRQLCLFPSEKLLDDWKMKALLFGKKITVLESKNHFTATAIDVNQDGSLLIQTESGQKRNIFAGDVSVAYR